MSRLLDQYGQPIQRAVLAEEQTARIGWVTREFAEHPSRGLTPARLHWVLEEAEQGVLSAQADLFTDDSGPGGREAGVERAAPAAGLAAGAAPPGWCRVQRGGRNWRPGKGRCGGSVLPDGAMPQRRGDR